MNQQNVWGNNLIDFNKLSERSNVLNRWFLVGYLMSLINENLVTSGNTVSNQLGDNETDTINLNQLGGVDTLSGQLENEIRPVFGSLISATSDKVCLISSTLGFNNVVETGEETSLLARGMVESFWADSS